LPQTADLSAKNLGDEGFAYVVDALSFNDKCAAQRSMHVIAAQRGSQQPVNCLDQTA
jgi:hypothetical protein